MKKSSFEPIGLRGAKRHIEWLNSKLIEKKDILLDREKRKKATVFSKIVAFLKKIF